MPARPNHDPLEEYRRKRDFGRTSEPAGEIRERRAGARRLAFVIQKHDATSLHYDLRLEIDGVMKSWAVPRGMTLDPGTRRLAMQTEDHPMDYNAFEGTIPSGGYGGGTVMVWDRGHYFADEAAEGQDEEAVLRGEFEAGKMSVSFVGERMHGSYALVRTEGGRSPKWLLIKHRDDFVRRGVDPGEIHTTSAVTGRTLDEIANEDATDGFEGVGFSAMLFRYVTELPAGTSWAFERAIRGARVHFYVTPDARQIVPAVPNTSKLYRDLGTDLLRYAVENNRAFVLDGEIAPADNSGGGLLFSVYDLLFEDDEVLVDKPWTDRRKRLETLFQKLEAPDVQLLPISRRGGASLIARAHAAQWAGISAKRVTSPYRPGTRSNDWLRTIFPQHE
jgi:bifunctional non-homologous end joining protein LigD